MKLSLILVICSVCVCVARKGVAWHQIEDQRNDDDIIKNDDIDDVISDITDENEKLDVFDDDVDFELANDVREIALKEILSADAKPAWFKGIIRKVVKKVGTGVKKAARVTKKLIKAVVNTFKRLKVCYPPYGCFTNQKPWNLIWHVLPKPPSDIRTFYELHTRRNPTGKRLNPFRVRESGLDGRKKTIIIIHGWQEHYDELVWNRRMKDELLKRGDFNVIGVYWPGGARTGYSQAAGNTRLVGAQVAYLIEKLCRYQKLSYRRVHLIGFSLGAHVAGFAGRRIREKRHRIARITGLDPAGPVFSRRPNKARLDSTDANFVDVLHTSFLYLVGIKDVSGDVDFYVNGGGRQPGCLVKGLLGAACSHSRAIELFTRTINPKCTFTAYKCKSYSRFRLGWCRNCRKANCVTMGYDTPTTARGRYYVRTSAKKPFC